MPSVIVFGLVKLPPLNTLTIFLADDEVAPPTLTVTPLPAVAPNVKNKFVDELVGTALKLNQKPNEKLLSALPNNSVVDEDEAINAEFTAAVELKRNLQDPDPPIGPTVG